MSVSSGGEMADSTESDSESITSAASKLSRISASGRKRPRPENFDEICKLRDELAKAKFKNEEMCQMLNKAYKEIKMLSTPLTTQNKFDNLLAMDTENIGNVRTITKSKEQEKNKVSDVKSKSNTTSSGSLQSPMKQQKGKKIVTLPENAAKSAKPPPIIAYDLDTKICIEELKVNLGHNKFNLVKLNSNCSKVITNNTDDHKKACELLKSHNADHYTFTRKEERKINVLLKGIDQTYTENDIKDELIACQLKIDLGKIMLFSKPNSVHPTWLVQLEPQSDVNSLLSMKYFLNQKVKFERLKGGRVLQCRRCQRFGHSAGNCNLKFRCLKCLEKHDPGQCKNNLNTDENGSSPPASCVNCGATGHPANYRGCPKYAELIKKKQNHVNEQKEQQLFKQRSFQNFRHSEVSYASLMHANTNTNVINKSKDNSNNNCLSFFNKECNAYFGMNFSQIISKTAEFAPKYMKMDDSLKPFELLQFMMSITPSTR